MASVVSSRSSTVIMTSEKENMTFSKQNGHYSYLNEFRIEEDSLIESLPSLYFSEVTKKEDTEEVDTEDDDDENMPTKPTVENTPPIFEHINASSKLTLDKKTPLLSSSFSHSQLNNLTPIQTYLPQLNHSFYSPTSSVVSSIRSKKSSRYNYPISVASHHSDNHSTCSTPETPVVPVPLPTRKRITPLYPIQNTKPAPPKNDQMEVCSANTSTKSASRIKNAFQKLRPAKHHHQNTNTNSVVPAEIVSTIKLASSKNSLADKIRNKLQQQLDKTKNRSSLIEVSKTKSGSTFSLPRSSSLSSLSNWSARLSKSNKKNHAGLSSSATMTNLRNTPLVVSHSIASSLSSTSSEDSSSVDEKLTATNTTPFSLKKSMSSHKLYNHKKSSYYGPSNPETLMTDCPKKDSIVRFKKMVSVRETFSKSEYDRASDPDAVCTRLTPVIAQQIKDELNSFKLNEMKVHESSRGHTHFFL